MNRLKVLRARPGIFFRLSGIRLEDFDDLVKKRTRSGSKTSINACLARTANAPLVQVASMNLIFPRSF